MPPSSGEFESGLSGQTKEHIVLARSLGVGRLIVAVNQMDCAGWAQSRYDEIVASLAPILAQVGFKSPAFVPLSAIEGTNLAPGTARPADGALDWYEGRSLLEEISRAEISARTCRVGTRLCVGGLGRVGATTLSVSGTLQAGTRAV